MDKHDEAVMLFLLKTIERLTDNLLVSDLEPEEIEEINYEARYLSSLYRGDGLDD